MDIDFWQRFKEDTERRWSVKNINPSIFGFQIQADTKWLPGHTKEEIFQLENSVLTKLPLDVINLLSFTKGLSRSQYNANPNGGKTFNQQWKLNIEYLKENYHGELEFLRQENSLKTLETLTNETSLKLVPIYSHRFIVFKDPSSYKIYSIYGEDIIVYAENLEQYLNIEFK